MVNVIVEIPTGYVISRDTREWMYKANFTGLLRIRIYMQKLILFFSHVSIQSGQELTSDAFINYSDDCGQISLNVNSLLCRQCYADRVVFAIK